MNTTTYREGIKRTMNKDLSQKDALAMLGLGLSGEVGELVDMIKKMVYHGHNLDKAEVVKEMGDIYWYLHNLMNELDVSHELVMQMNIAKLQKRYPEGFSEADSQRRVDTVKDIGNKISVQAEQYFADNAVEYAKHKAYHEANKPT